MCCFIVFCVVLVCSCLQLLLMFWLVELCILVSMLWLCRQCISLMICFLFGCWQVLLFMLLQGIRFIIVKWFLSRCRMLFIFFRLLLIFLSRVYWYWIGQLIWWVQVLLVFISFFGFSGGVLGNSCWCSLVWVLCRDRVRVGFICCWGRCLNMWGLLMVENIRFLWLMLLLVLSRLMVLRMLLRLCVGLFMFMNIIFFIVC